MEGLFDTTEGAPLVLIGQPDMDKQRLDNAIHIPKMLSFITYQRWEAQVHGLNEFPKDQHPDNIPLLYYSFHMMVGLGTIFIAIMGISVIWLWRGWLFTSNWLMWIIMLSFPLPFIANTVGWMTPSSGGNPGSYMVCSARNMVIRRWFPAATCCSHSSDFSECTPSSRCCTFS
jgi:cytochrome d ubiquinol oxidase subunit I